MPPRIPKTNKEKQTVEDVFLSPIPHGETFTREDRDSLKELGYSERQLREAFSKGFLSKTGDLSKNSDKDYEIRRDARDMYFQLIEELGYDPGDFDWEEWRDYADYNNDD